jgi:hypothetical protein
MNTSTPVKRIRFRGDSFQSESESLLDNDYSDEVHSTKNGDISRNKGLFTKISMQKTRQRIFIKLFYFMYIFFPFRGHSTRF